MKGLENQTYLIAYIISNVVALALLVVAIKWPKAARVLFFALFSWASWTNWSIALNNPQAYVDYANFVFIGFYKQFIQGWFSRHILPVVGFIATAQALVAVSQLLKGRIYKTGVTGAIVFLIAIVPFGVGSAFPCTLIMAVALLFLWRQNDYVWHHKKGGSIIAVR